jgi:hypothetical protein
VDGFGERPGVVCEALMIPGEAGWGGAKPLGQHQCGLVGICPAEASPAPTTIRGEAARRAATSRTWWSAMNLPVQPPCANPRPRSSPACPAPWINPSSDTYSTTTKLLTGLPLRSQHFPFAS